MKDGKSLANIKRVEIETIEETPRVFDFTTAESAGLKPKISQGTEKECRSKDTIRAVLRTEDIVTGYDITITDSAFRPEVFALVNAGTLEYDNEDPKKVIGFKAPPAGVAVKRTKFNAKFYTEELDASGDALGYACFKFSNCKGKPVSFELKDGEFYVPEMQITSFPKQGQSPVEIDFLDELPE